MQVSLSACSQGATSRPKRGQLHPRAMRSLFNVSDFGMRRLRVESPAVRGHTAAAAARAFDYDSVVVGGGSGGVRFSRAATDAGARVVVVEEPFALVPGDHEGGLGGTCVIRGCIPKKIMAYGSEYSRLHQESKAFGWRANPHGELSLDWRAFLSAKDREVKRLEELYRKMLDGKDIETITGEAELVDDHTVRVKGPEGDTRLITAQHVVIATGARPVMPPIPGIEHAVTSDQVMELQELPRSMVIIGGGYIGCEMAGIFSGFGVDVHLVLRGPRPLKNFDGEVAEFLAKELSDTDNITIHASSAAKAIRKVEDGTLAVDTEDGELRADCVLAAMGRRPNVAGLGLESVGVAMDDKTGAIQVDEMSRSSVESVFAVGDVTNRIPLTPVAIMEGKALAKTLYGGQPTPVDHTYVPSAVFSSPAVGTVGLTEEAARERVKDVDVYTSTFVALRCRVAGCRGRCLTKVIVDAHSRRVLGLHLVGPDAPEIVQGFALALKMGCTKEQLDGVVGVHPTAAEEVVTMENVTRRYRGGELA